MVYGLHDAPGSQLATRRAWAPFGSAKYGAPVAGNTPALDEEARRRVPKAVGHVGRPKSADRSGAQSDVGAAVDAVVHRKQVRSSDPGAQAQRVAQEGSYASTQTQTAADNGVDQPIERIKDWLNELLIRVEETVRKNYLDAWKIDNPAFRVTMEEYVEEFNAAIENARQAVPGDDVIVSLNNSYDGIMLAGRIQALYDSGEIFSVAFEARQQEQDATFRTQLQDALEAEIARIATALAEDAERRAQEADTKLETKIRALEASNTDLSARFEAQAAKAEGLQSELSRVQGRLEAAEAAKNKLKEENAEFALQVSETIANTTQLEKPNTSYLKEKKTRERLEQELAESKASVLKLTRDLARAQVQKVKAEESEAQIRAECEEFLAVHLQLQRELSAERERRSRAADRPNIRGFIGKELTIAKFMQFSEEKATFVVEFYNYSTRFQDLHNFNYQKLQEIVPFPLPNLKTETGQSFKSGLSVNTEIDDDKKAIMAIYSAVVFQLFFEDGFTCEYNPSKKNPTLEFSRESGDKFTIMFPQKEGRFEFRAGDERRPVTEAGSITKEDAPFFVHTESTTKGEYAEGESAGVV